LINIIFRLNVLQLVSEYYDLQLLSDYLHITIIRILFSLTDKYPKKLLMNNNRKLILQWSESGHIQKEDVNQAIQLAQADPTPFEWVSFLKAGLLWLSFLFICFGVLFFFAFNWQEMSRMTKFSLVELMMVLSLVVNIGFSSKPLLASASLISMVILTGVLLALVGQTYQTGADPWQLFFVWAILILPWALVAKESSLWIILISLLNLSLYLHLNISQFIVGMLFNDESSSFIFALFNTILLVLFELKQQWLTRNKRITHQLLMLFSGVPFTYLAIFSIFDSSHYYSGFIAYLIWAGALFYWFRYKQLDLFALSAGSLSGIIVTMSLLVKLLENTFGGGSFLIISIVIIGLSTFSGIWLKKIAKEINELEHNKLEFKESAKESMEDLS